MTEHSVAEFWIPALIIAMGAIVVILETFGGIRAAYGRYNKSNFGLPSWIAWCLQESTSFFVSLIIWIYRGPQLFDSNGRLNTNLLLLAYFMFHYFHRSFVYSLRIQSNKKLNYLENMFGFFFCTINGLQIAHYHVLYPNFALNQWNFWLGSALFWLGLYINIDSDNRLLRLRSSSSSSSKSSSTKSAYKIPQGGFFEYVSAANYAGECLEWLGFAIASWSLSGFAFSFFTFANIGPRAYHHHLYYKELFGDKYPKNRKALIPFLL